MLSTARESFALDRVVMGLPVFFTQAESNTPISIVNNSVLVTVFIVIVIGAICFFLGRKTNRGYRNSHYQSILEKQTNYIARFKPNGQLTYANNAFRHYFKQYDKPDTSRSFISLIHEEDRPRFQSTVSKITSSNHTVTLDHRILLDDGTIRWNQWDYRGLFDDQNEIVELQASGIDITDRKDTERALRNSQEKYRLYIDNSPDGFFVIDRSGKFIDFNDAVCTISGYDVEDLLEMTIFNLISGIVPTATLNQFKHALIEGQTNTELTCFKKDGSEFDLEISTVGTSEDRLIGFCKDVTDRNRAERAKQESQRQKLNVLESITDAFIAFDREWRFTYVNQKAEELLRRSRHDLKGNNVWKTFPEFIGTDFEKQIHKAMNDQQAVELVQYYPRFNVWFEIQSYPYEEGLSIYFRNINARIHAEEDLKKAIDAAETANQTKSEFLANMSHELRTPLNSVIGFANILKKNKEANLSEKQINFIERIQYNGHHLLSLINEILDLSKIESGRIELNLATFPLDDLVNEILPQFEERVSTKPVDLGLDSPPGLKPILTDRGKMKQVLINLIANAIKFTDRGSVTVRIECNEENRIPRRLLVQDTGIGIPEKRLSAIFEAFQQADSSTSRKYGGTGLGLTISRNLCELMGHTLDVESELGVGSTFIVTFGYPSDDSVTVLSDSVVMDRTSELIQTGIIRSGQPERFDGKRILIIDDEKDARDLFIHYLEEVGCQTMEAASGEEGLVKIKSERPDLIVLDLILPGMNGWEVLIDIKSNPELRDIPVIVASIIAKEIRGINLGLVDLLDKPLKPEELIRVLKRNLRQKSGSILILDDNDTDRRFISEFLADEGIEIRATANIKEALAIMSSFTPSLIVLDLLLNQNGGLEFIDTIRRDPRYINVPVVVVTTNELSEKDLERLNQAALAILRKGHDFEHQLKEIVQKVLLPGFLSQRSK